MSVTKTLSAKAFVSVLPYMYLLPNRKIKVNLGFDDENIQVFQGRNNMPEVNQTQMEASLKCWDELEKIADFKLTGGELQIDIRTDRYVWNVLDAVYEDYFLQLASCDTDEVWTGDDTDEEVYQRTGDGAKKLEAATGTSVDTLYTFSSSQDLTTDGLDKISFFLYLDSIDNLDLFELRLKTDASNYYYIDNTIVDLQFGWNQIWVDKSEFLSELSPDWSDITIVEVILTANVSGAVTAIYDDIRAVDSINYPRRIFDIGLQEIPVAWFAGNTALYEIKTACECEGARFFSDENGILRFENRQFYNLNDEYKSSVCEFTFDNMTDLKYPTRQIDLINKVIIKLKPRQVVASAEGIWSYPYTPLLEPDETRTIWASLIDPCPTTTDGIIQPVATTDYTANTQADGGGTDKTADISIVITRFANAVKLDVTNDGVANCYITKLDLRGTPAKESDEVVVTYQDDQSIANYGERPAGGLIIENKYLADEEYAQSRAEQIVGWYANPRTKIVLNSRAMPQLQIGDMVSVYNDTIDVSYLMRITKIKTQLSVNTGMNQTLELRMVMPQETLTYFEIGASEIDSTDVIAP